MKRKAVCNRKDSDDARCLLRRATGDLPLSPGVGQHPPSGRGRGDRGGPLSVQLGLCAQDLAGT